MHHSDQTLTNPSHKLFQLLPYHIDGTSASGPRKQGLQGRIIWNFLIIRQKIAEFHHVIFLLSGETEGIQTLMTDRKRRAVVYVKYKAMKGIWSSKVRWCRLFDYLVKHQDLESDCHQKQQFFLLVLYLCPKEETNYFGVCKDWTFLQTKTKNQSLLSVSFAKSLLSSSSAVRVEKLSSSKGFQLDWVLGPLRTDWGSLLTKLYTLFWEEQGEPEGVVLADLEYKEK